MIVLLTIFISTVASAKAAKAVKAVKIQVLTENYYPMQYWHQGEFIGPSAEIITKTLHQAGLEYTITVLPWARAYRRALVEKNVMIFSMARGKQREPLFNWIGSLMDLNYFLYGLPTTAIPPNTPLLSLNNYRLSFTRESLIQHYLIANGIFNYHAVNNRVQSIKMLLAGRVDLISGVSAFFYKRCQHLQLDCRKIKPLYELKDAKTGLYFAMSKSTDRVIVNQLKAAYQKVMLRSKSVSELIKAM